MVDELWGDLLNMNAKDPAYVLCQTRNTPYLTSDRPYTARNGRENPCDPIHGCIVPKYAQIEITKNTKLSVTPEVVCRITYLTNRPWDKR